MATSTEEIIESPKVKFRWCRTVPCKLSDVQLELTSLSECLLTLHWNEDLGWFESDFISLPNGLHTGYLNVRTKSTKLRSVLNVTGDLVENLRKTDEREIRQFKVDPFYVSSNRFSIELFLHKEENLWQSSDQPSRYLSCQQFNSESTNKEANYELAKRRCSSSYELRTFGNYEENKDTEHDETSLLFPEFPMENSTGTESFVNKCNTPKKSLSYDRKWRSLDHNISGSNGDSDEIVSSRSAKSDSFKLVGDLFNKIHNRRPDHHKSLYDSAYSSTGRKVHGFDFWKINNGIKTQSINSLIHSSKSDEDISQPKYSEHASKNNEPRSYKCVITFESRSTSMDDVGSPRALEEALVSLTSSENTDKNTNCKKIFQYCSFPKNEARLYENIKAQQQDLFVRNRLLFNCQQQLLTDKSSLSENRPPSSSSIQSNESSSTLYDDVNFDYETSVDDNEKLHLNLHGVFSESMKSVESDSKARPIKSRSDPRCEMEGIKLSDSELQSVNYRKVKIDAKATKRTRNEYKLRLESSCSSDKASDPNLKSVAAECDNSETECSSSVFSEDGSTDMLIKESGQKPILTVREYKNKNKNMSKIPSKKEHVNVVRSNLHSNTGLKKRYASMMESTSTQTSRQKQTITTEENELPHRIPFSILPDRIRTPYYSTFRKVNPSKLRFSKRDLSEMQANLYNLVKADKLLRKIHIVQDSISSRANIAARNLNVYPTTYYRPNVYTPLYRYPTYKPKKPVVSFNVPESNKRYSSVREPLSAYGVQPSYYPPEKLRPARNLGAIPFERSQLRTISSLPDLTFEPSESYSMLPRQYNSSRTIDTDWNYDRSSLCGSRSRYPKSSYSTHSYADRKETPSFMSSTRQDNGAKFESGNSTDCLIEEADQMLRSSRSDQLDYKKIDRVNSAMPLRSQTKLKFRTLSSGNLDSSSIYNDHSYYPPRSETSVSGSIRTRSETDLRLLGRLGEGTRGEPPYLPYRNDHLSIGQLVKVLVPGGVALARVAYAPSYSRLLHDQLISVVILSEPSLSVGNLVTVPVNRVLLAWPKSSDCYRNI